MHEIELIQIPTDAGTFTARAVGDAADPLMLMLHGFPRTSHLFRHLMLPAAGTGRRVVAFDQRGYSPGVRPDRKEDYAMDELVADVARVADSLEAETFDLLGHDWGGIVAWRAAAQHSDRVRSLCVLSTPHPSAFSDELSSSNSDQAERSSYMDMFCSPMAETIFLNDDAANLRSMLSSPGTTEADVVTYADVLTQAGAFTGALNWYRENLSPGSSGRPIEVAAPVLHVAGTEDHAFSMSAVERSARHVSGPYRLVRLEGATHFLPEECPERFLSDLVAHLGGDAAQGSTDGSTHGQPTHA